MVALRWLTQYSFLLLGAFAAHRGVANADAAYLAWVGFGAIVIATLGTKRLSPAFIAIVFAMMGVFPWVADTMHEALGRTWLQSNAVMAVLAGWEGLPMMASVAVGLLLHKRGAPIWSLFVVPTGTFTGLSVWLPCPYGYSLGATLVTQLPGSVWLLGSDLLGGMAIGVCFVACAILLDDVRVRTAVVTLSIPLALLGIGELGFIDYTSRMLSVPKVHQEVVAVQGSVAPFSSGYALMIERAMYPLILFGTLHPDIILFPENMIQVGISSDADSNEAMIQREASILSMIMCVPTSQVVLTARDFTASRIYWSRPKADDIPDVEWADMEKRTVGVDYAPSWLPRKIRDIAWGGADGAQIQPQQLGGTISLVAPSRSQKTSGEYDPIGTAIPLLSGEIRNPRLVQRVRGDANITVAINPTVSGWLGVEEAKIASVQARARLTELGLIGYRIGQLTGTEYVVPWCDTVLETAGLGNGCIMFTADIPEHKTRTGFTVFGWALAFYLLPFSAVGLLLVQLGAMERLKLVVHEVQKWLKH